MKDCCCGNQKLMSVTAKCSDMCNITMKDVNYTGYVPDGLGIGSGDYISFRYCVSCGQIHDFRPFDVVDFIEDNKVSPVKIK